MFARQSGPFQPSSHFALTDDVLLMLGFSTGSPLPPSRVMHPPSGTGLARSFSNITSISVHATGQKSSSTTNSQLDMHVQPSTDHPMAWQWTPTQLRAAPRFTSTASTMPPRNVFSAPSSSDKSQRQLVSQSHAVPTSPIPMAVPLTPNITRDEPLILPSALPPSMNPRIYPVPPPSVSTRLPDIAPPSGRPLGSFAREKKHGCWMCHKSFDRPSTLRKHLLVHTGERAHVCETCGRRFGVASNLNRHVKRCLQRPVHSSSTKPADANPEQDTSPPSPPSEPPPTHEIFTAPLDTLEHNAPSLALIPPDLPQPSSTKSPTSRTKRPRPQASSSPSGSPQSVSPTSPDPRRKQSLSSCASPSSGTPKQHRVVKRRRRAPSPSHWIPFSLLAFDLNPIEFERSTLVPLAPVSPSATEERNSFDENVGVAPYREHWKGRLPGPGLASGLGRKDIGNIGEHGGYFMGRLSLV